MNAPTIDQRRFAFRMKAYGVLALAVGAYLIWASLTAWKETHGFLINTTDSLPNWAFLLDRTVAPAKGALIFFRVPPSHVVDVHFGKGEHLFGKLVLGVPGDVVSRDGQTLSVNGHPVAVAKVKTKRGLPLAVGPVGTIPEGCYYVGTGNKDGFDSRYAQIGWICRDRIVGTGKAIL